MNPRRLLQASTSGGSSSHCTGTPPSGARVSPLYPFRSPPKGRIDACCARRFVLLKRRPETKMRVERAEGSCDAKLARYLEQHDKAQGSEREATPGTVPRRVVFMGTTGNAESVQRTAAGPRAGGSTVPPGTDVTVHSVGAGSATGSVRVVAAASSSFGREEGSEGRQAEKRRQDAPPCMGVTALVQYSFRKEPAMRM